MPFSTFGLHASLVRAVRDLSFTQPTAIQEEAIPPAMQGRDLLACAATGSGKTAAFLLPTLHRLLARSAGRRAVRALVLTPTRELAAQIHEHFVSLAAHTSIHGAAIFGGVGMGPQIHAFRTGVELLVATPGRLLDHLKQPYAKLDQLEILILDEADRMLDMGFLPDIRRILHQLPSRRQTLFFSATMPPEIRQLTGEMLRDPVSIQIQRQAAPAASITQSIYPVPQHLKSMLLCELLKNDALASVICFTRTKHRANRLADYLSRHGVSCAPIHGNRSQSQRTAALEGFRSGRHRVLVATDIAARGIDVADVSHVINFDCPHVPEDYIHRVGRTGRAAATGEAFTFVSPEEECDLRMIERAINRRLPRTTVHGFDYAQKPTEKLEIPLAERLAAMRQRKKESRARRSADGHAPAGGMGHTARPHATAGTTSRRDQNRRKPHLPGHAGTSHGGFSKGSQGKAGRFGGVGGHQR